MRTMSGYAMVGGTIPPQSDSGEISRVLVLNLLWQSKRCSRTAQDISVLTAPSLLSRGTRRIAGSPEAARSRGAAARGSGGLLLHQECATVDLRPITLLLNPL